MDAEDDHITSALSSRRFPHTSRRGGTNQAAFDPRRLFGVYELDIPALTMRTDAGTGPKNVLEIHEFTYNDTAVLGTLTLDGGVLAGVCVLAGSRKVLQSAVEELEQEEQDGMEDEQGDESASCEEAEGPGREDMDSDEERNDDHLSDCDDALSVPAAEDRREHRHRAFEKNSFRNPKFWMRWKGRITVQPNGKPAEERVDMGSAYLIFATNECKTLKGTLYCEALGWDNVEVTGRKVTGKARGCPLKWNYFV